MVLLYGHIIMNIYAIQQKVSYDDQYYQNIDANNITSTEVINKEQENFHSSSIWEYFAQ